MSRQLRHALAAALFALLSVPCQAAPAKSGAAEDTVA